MSAMNTWWVWLVQALALCMVVSSVCRAVKMDASTHEPVRLALVLQGGAAFALAVIPFGRPGWLLGLVALFVATTLAGQAITSRYWRRGQPEQLRKW